MKAITNPPMFTAKNSNVSHAKSTNAFNTVMAHLLLIHAAQRENQINQSNRIEKV